MSPTASRFALVAVLGLSVAAAAPDTSRELTVREEPLHFRASHLGAEIVVLPGVFLPAEAENEVLPVMSAHRDWFRGKRVLEIGTGSGIIALYAARLGATRVVATDISETAVETARTNASALGFDSVVDVRLVPPSDMSAYSVIADDERFDVVLSSPPYSLDLDATRNTAVTDTGDLGFSIVRELDRHLEPGGMALLFYNELFYHHLMVKFARHQGFEVRHSSPRILTTWAADALFNSYAERLLERERARGTEVRFDWQLEHPYARLGRRPSLHGIRVGFTQWLVRGGRGPDDPLQPGWMLFRRPGSGS